MSDTPHLPTDAEIIALLRPLIEEISDKSPLYKSIGVLIESHSGRWKLEKINAFPICGKTVFAKSTAELMLLANNAPELKRRELEEAEEKATKLRAELAELEKGTHE